MLNPNDKMSGAAAIYAAAKAGGEYAQFYEKNRNLYLARLRRASKSYGKIIADHEEWIRNPALKLAPGLPQEAVKRYAEQKWPKDIARNSAYKAIIDGIIQDRENGKAD
jgi:hypothetical protein